MFKLVKSLILLVICAISVKCQKIDELSQSEYFPFYVIIKHGNVFWCPGSLIRPNFVITSWHCAETLEIDDTTIVESNEQVVKVLLKRQIVDEGMIWNQETPFLLQLLEPFTINFTTNVIEIATQKVEDLRVVKVVGYDQKNELKFDYFINLKSTWDRKLKQRPLITGSDCHSSLGAPMISVSGNKLYGLGIDHQARHCHLGAQSVFDDISRFHSWINKTINELSPISTNVFPTTEVSADETYN